MRKTQSNLPVLDNGFENQTILCIHLAPILEDRDSVFEALNIHTIKKVLFINNSWRLTGTGCQILSEHFVSYTSNHNDNTVLTGKILLNMDKCCLGPWFLRGKTITVFDPTIHFELQMVSGKLGDFVDFKTPAKN